MKVSIVTAYYNRKKLFRNTLLRLKYSLIQGFEVIAVDDGSSAENRLEDLQKEFSFLKVIRVEPTDKWYINPCVPFNKGIKAAKGEIIILQNPECVHYGDILKYVVDNLQPNEYFSFASYSLDKVTTDALNDNTIRRLEFSGLTFLPQKVDYDGAAGWYNHSVYKPRGFHWCAAINCTDLLDLRGFDERFAMGVGFDDDELLARIKKKGMNLKIIDEPFVLHQNHFEVNKSSDFHVNPFYSQRKAKFLWDKNEYLLNTHTLKSKHWKASCQSRIVIKFFDLMLTVKLKIISKTSSLFERKKNKLKRILR